MFSKFSTLTRLTLLGVGTLVVVAVYWEVLADQGFVRTPLQLNETYFRASYLINFVIVMFTCFAVCEFMLKQYRPSIRAMTGILLLFLISAAMANVLGFPRQFWPALIAYHAPPIVVSAVCYLRWLANRDWRLPFPRASSDHQGEVLIGNVKSDLLADKLGLDRKIATEITELHVRANALMRRSSAVLAIIVVVLVFTAAFIVLANKIAEIGIVRIDPYVDLVEEGDEINREIDAIQTRLSRSFTDSSTNPEFILQLNGDILQLEKEIETQPEPPPEMVSQLNRLKATLGELRDREMRERQALEMEKSMLRQDLEYLSNRREDVAEERDKARGRVLSQELKSGSDGNEGPKSDLTASDLLIATGVTRFGVLIISVYLVQILITLYRYNTRTAAYYRAHADALLLSNENPKAMKALHKALVPNVDYGKLPRTVMQDVGARAADKAKRYIPGGGGPERAPQPPSA